MSIWKKVHINSGTTYLYKTDNHLGFGSYSEVYRGSKEGSDEQVAIKVVYKPRAGDKYLDEPRIHKEMSSDPNIVRLLHTFQTENNLYLVIELCNGGTLRDMLNKSSNGRIEFHMAVEYLAAIVDALYTVHTKGVTHRDIKPENMLFKDGKIKLGDFGSATYDKMSTSYKGTLDYLAPEMMLDEINYDNKVDIWALGIVFFEMLYGEKPYMWNNEKKTFEELKVSTRTGKPLKDCYVSKEAKDLLRKMLTVDPDNRITIDKVKEHALFMKHQDMKDDAYCLIKSLKDLLEDEAQGEYYLSLLKEKKQLEIYFEDTMNKDLDDAIIIDESTIERLQ